MAEDVPSAGPAKAGAVEAWLEDCRRPFPGAVDLAAHISKLAKQRHFLGWSRDAIISLAGLIENQDRLVKAQAELIAGLTQEAESLRDGYRVWRQAAHGAAQTAEVALGRLLQQEALVRAALEWARATETFEKTEAMGTALDAAKAYLEVVGRRS